VFNASGFRYYRKQSSVPVPGTDAVWYEHETTDLDTIPEVTPSDTFADGDWYMVATRYNGCIESDPYPIGPNGEQYLFMRIADGYATGDPPGGLVSAELENRAGGVVRVVAHYYTQTDAATWWGVAEDIAVNYSTDGSEPAEDSPVATVAISGQGLLRITYDIPAQADGTTVRACVQVRRNDNTDADPRYSYSAAVQLTTTADATGPTSPQQYAPWRGVVPETSS